MESDLLLESLGAGMAGVVFEGQDLEFGEEILDSMIVSLDGSQHPDTTAYSLPNQTTSLSRSIYPSQSIVSGTILATPGDSFYDEPCVFNDTAPNLMAELHYNVVPNVGYTTTGPGHGIWPIGSYQHLSSIDFGYEAGPEATQLTTFTHFMAPLSLNTITRDCHQGEFTFDYPQICLPSRHPSIQAHTPESFILTPGYLPPNEAPMIWEMEMQDYTSHFPRPDFEEHTLGNISHFQVPDLQVYSNPSYTVEPSVVQNGPFLMGSMPQSQIMEDEPVWNSIYGYQAVAGSQNLAPNLNYEQSTDIFVLESRGSHWNLPQSSTADSLQDLSVSLADSFRYHRKPRRENTTKRTCGKLVRPRKMRRKGRSCSLSTDYQWTEMKIILNEIYMKLNEPLHRTELVTDLVFNFQWGRTKFQKMFKEWGFHKNNRLESPATSAFRSDGGVKSEHEPRTKSKKSAKTPTKRNYAFIPERQFIPPRMRYALYKTQVILLCHLDKYISGFYDSRALLPAQGLRDEDWRSWEIWEVFYSRCHDAFVQKKSERKGQWLDRAFGGVRYLAHLCSPPMIGHFWNTLHLLQRIAPQLRMRMTNQNSENRQTHEAYATWQAALPGIILRYFLTILLQFLSVNNGYNNNLLKIVETLLLVIKEGRPDELSNTIRICHLCSIKSSAGKIGDQHSLVLEMWSSYFTHWDTQGLCRREFLRSYEEALIQSEIEYQETADQTLSVLQDYALVSHYICHDNELSRRLAITLWDRAHARMQNKASEWPPRWNMVYKSLATSAKILALQCCITHENKRKSSEEMREIRNKLNLKSRANRRKWRRTMPSPNFEQICLGLTCLGHAIGILECGDFDCRRVAADLSACLVGLAETWRKNGSKKQNKEGKEATDWTVVGYYLNKIARIRSEILKTSFPDIQDM